MIYADNKEAKSIVDVLLSSAFFVVSSQIVLPLWPVSVTMQTFAIFFVGLLLSPRKSFFSVLVWPFAGSVGLPVITSGLGGPTSGYLVGMLVGAPLFGLLRSKRVSVVSSCVACLAVVYSLGCVCLARFIGLENVLACGVIPFILPDLFKIALACSLIVLKK